MSRQASKVAIFLLGLALSLSTTAAHADKRVALVVGNSAYRNTAALTNPVNDSEDVATALKKVGFTVLIERNLDKRGMEDAVARFARLAQDADAALFFYAGHGMQYRGQNYLMPVEARLEDEFKVTFELTRLDDILFGLERARGVKILILDACRNNPLADRLTRTARSRDVILTHGLAKIEANRGMVIAYSTQANHTAVDGEGRNSPFTAALVKQIDEPGVEIGALFRRVAADVNAMTKGRQLPELSVSLVGDFYLNNRDTDLQAWAKLRGSTDLLKLRGFISQYPNSPLASDVQDRLAALDREKAHIEQAIAREQADRQKAERERVARDQVERERVERERLERESLARAQAERDKAPVNVQTALLPPSPSVPPTVSISPSGGALIMEIKKELKRVGCYAGRVDGEWATVDTKESVRRFVKFAKLPSEPADPATDFLNALKGKSERTCPLECGTHEVEKSGRCVKRKAPINASLGTPERKERATSPSAVARADQAKTAGTYQECMGARSGCYERAVRNTHRFPTPEAARAWCTRRPTC